MPASGDFFEHRSAPAVLKHGILTRYAYYFAGRAGSATSGRVAFIDGYAGEGRYDDGTPGSPVLLASQANRLTVIRRQVKLAFVEQDDDRRNKLGRSLADHGIEPDQLLDEGLEEVVDKLLDRYDRHAVLLFVDPFGLAFDRATLERVLRRSAGAQPIDVLYHFSVHAVARMGALGVTGKPGAQQNAAHLDAALGPIGWQADFLAGKTDGATHAALTVAKRFGDSVRQATGVQSTAIPVRQRPDHLPKYLLMLFSKNQKAHWDFADLAAKAHVEWLHHCDTEDYEAYVRRQEDAGTQEMFPEPAPSRDGIEQELRAGAQAYLREHLAELLGERRALRPIDAIEDVYGTMLGRAGIPQLRAAVKALHGAGLVDDDGVGDFQTRTVTWTGD